MISIIIINIVIINNNNNIIYKPLIKRATENAFKQRGATKNTAIDKTNAFNKPSSFLLFVSKSTARSEKKSANANPQRNKRKISLFLILVLFFRL